MMSPIIITGVPRSGTSLTCGILNLHGVFGGDMRGPTRHNQKGMFENKKIVELFKTYLLANNSDPMGQFPLPDLENLKPWPSLNDDVENVITEDGYPGGPWFFKTVKGCHVWPVVYNAFPDAKWVIVRRNERANALSLNRTPFMRAYKDLEGWKKYIHIHTERFQEIQRYCNAAEVNVDRVVNGDFSELSAVFSWLGLTFQPEIAKRFIEPELFDGHS